MDTRNAGRLAKAATVRGQLAGLLGGEINLLNAPATNERETALRLYILYGKMIDSLTEIRTMLEEDFPGVRDATGG